MVPKRTSDVGFRKTITINEDDSNRAHRTGGGKSQMRRCVSAPTTGFDIMNISSIMKWSTLDESIGHSYGGSEGTAKHRSLQFGTVKIREYARTVGDNPSCSSGPPVR